VKLVVLGALAALLLIGSVAVFLAYDSVSHSASDTIRPFVITVVPVWVVAGFATWAVLRRSSGSGT
jgi:hypothetical protein